jgi:RNA polymerase sigma factor (TIGR02999 family)
MVLDIIRTFLGLLMRTPKAMHSAEADAEVNELLACWNTADALTRSRVMTALYPELKRIAQLRMKSERADHTLQPTALVNELFLHFATRRVGWRSRTHFLAAASRAMRHILVDYSRAHRAEKRGGGGAKLPLDRLHLESGETPWSEFAEISDILDRLATEEPRMARVVEMKYFAGLSTHEMAEVLEIDERTVKRDWQVARAWLCAQLSKD